eukprot:2879142-Pleurochrysis_carterae.AAC.1
MSQRAFQNARTIARVREAHLSIILCDVLVKPLVQPQCPELRARELALVRGVELPHCDEHSTRASRRDRRFRA